MRRSTSPFATPVHALGWTLGLVYAALCLYTGVALVLPVVATCVLAWVGYKAQRPEGGMLFVVAIHGGFAISLAISLIAWRAFNWHALEPLLLGAAVVWLTLRPSLLPVVLLLGYQIVSLGYNIRYLTWYSIGTMEYRAVIAGIGVRVTSIAALGFAAWELRKSSALRMAGARE